MDSDEQLTIAIEAINNAKKVLDQASEDFEKFSKKATKEIEKIEKKFKEVGRKMTAVGKKMSLALTLPIAAFSALAIKGAASLDSLEKGFDRLTTASNINKEELLSSMREASAGTIADSSLILSANKAMSLGVAKNTEEMTTLLEIARVKGQNMGLSLDQAFNDIVTGLGRNSPLILDNLGIVVKLGKVNEKYADSLGKTVQELTALERKQALVNHVVAQGKAEVEAAGEMQLTHKERSEKATAAIRNLAETIGKIMLPIVAKIADKIAEWTDKFRELSPTIQKAIVIIGLAVAALGPLLIIMGSITSAIGVMLPVLAAVGVFLAGITAPVWLIIGAVTALIGALGLLGVTVHRLASDFDIAQGEMTKSVIDHTNKTRESLKHATEDQKTLLTNIKIIEKEIVQARKDGRDEYVKVKEGELAIMLQLEKMGALDRLNVRKAELESTSSEINKVSTQLLELEQAQSGFFGFIGKEERSAQIEDLNHDLKNLTGTYRDVETAMRKIESMGSSAFGNVPEDKPTGGGGGVNLFGSSKDSERAGKELEKAAEKARKEAEKVQKEVERLTDKFEKLFKDANQTFAKHRDEFSATKDQYEKDIDSLTAKLGDLQTAFDSLNFGLDESLAGKFTEQEKLVADLRKEITEKRKAGEDTSDLQSQLKKEEAAMKSFKDTYLASSQEVINKQAEISKLEGQLSRTSRFAEYDADREALQSQIDEKKKSLEEFMSNSGKIDLQVQEARRQNGLTDLERFVEDIEAKRISEKDKLEEEKKLIAESIAEKDKEFNKKKALFDSEKIEHQKLVDSFALGNEQMVLNADTTADQMIESYNRIKGTLDSLRAITAPEEGPDNRTDAQVFEISGAQSAVSPTAFGPTNAQTAVNRQQGELGGLAAGTTSTENPINITNNITVGSVDSPKRVNDISQSLAKVLKNAKIRQ